MSIEPLAWKGGHLRLLDQTQLPNDEVWLELTDHTQVAEAISSMRVRGAPAIGVLPEERLMLAPTVRQVAELLGAKLFAGTSELERLIEHFLIGGLVTEWGGNYFNRLPNQAVIARGGRADIQMAALNFPLRALVLTGCAQPPQYVAQRAEALDVPLLTVERNTHETAEALEALAGVVTVHHPEKIERFTAMVEQGVDLDALAARLAPPTPRRRRTPRAPAGT